MLSTNIPKLIIDKLRFSASERACLRNHRHLCEIEQRSSQDGVILVDLGDGGVNELLENLTLSKYLAKKTGLTVMFYQPIVRSTVVGAKGRIGRHLVRFFKDFRAARDAGFKEGLTARYATELDKARALELAAACKQNIHSKKDLLNYSIGNVPIGRAIYDTYLRSLQSPTVDLDHPRVGKLIGHAFAVYVIAERFFSENDVRFVLLSHCVYIDWQIVSDVARQHGAQVYTTYTSRFPPLHNVNANRGLQTVDHSRYRKIFSTFSPEQKNEALRRGRELIKNRLQGVLDDGLSYMSKSSYAQHADASPLPFDANRPRLVFMLHAFSDSPHIYKNMVFEDFWEWMIQTLKFMSEERLFKRYEIYLKPHPNRFEHEDIFIGQLFDRFKFLNYLNPDINNNDLARSKPVAIVSVYGTVAAEFSLLGVPVILCGDNPASAYSFAFECDNKERYFALITNADSLRVDQEVASEIYEFMYMHFIHSATLSFSEYPFGRSKRGMPHNISRIKDFKFSEFEEMVDNVMPKISGLNGGESFVDN